MLIVGSFALNNWNTNREIGDIDVICTYKEMTSYLEFCRSYGNDLYNKQEPIETSLNKYKLKKPNWHSIYKKGKYITSMPVGTQIEFELAVPGSSAEAYLELKKKGQRNWQLGDYNMHYFASPEILFSIKKSHINYPHKKWSRHIKDYSWLKNVVGEDKYPEITKLRKQETEDRLGALKTPSLDKSAEEFFDDRVSNKTFIHDDIHKIMAHREKPMYEYIKIDQDKVACSKEKFFALPVVDQINCVLEEAYVIALERCIIPMMYEGKRYISNISAFEWALMRICTTLCSGWFRQFAVDNYFNIYSQRNIFYADKFMEAVDQGRIVKINDAK